jgi:hypothetical protein
MLRAGTGSQRMAAKGIGAGTEGMKVTAAAIHADGS